MTNQMGQEDMPNWDVVIIGGGPAGSTAATLLADAGHRVQLLEKAHHPRFHIGESLLPANLRLFERLGVGDAVREIGMLKPAAEFVSPQHDNRLERFHFADAWDKSMPRAYQVRRSQLDEILLRNAAAHGADVVEGCQVREVEFLDESSGAIVSATHEDGRPYRCRARFVVDASGRDTLLANRLRTKQRNKKHNSSALYGHFRGARRHPGTDEGNITIYWFQHGWFWFIPLSDGTTSIGAVVWPQYLKQRARSTSIKAFFLETIATCPPLAERLADAQLVGDVEATGNFAYSGDVTHGRNFVLLGDAFAFVDPVFSTGVMLAMQSAFIGAQAVDTCLRDPARAGAALAKFDRDVRRGPKEFSWFIYRMTSPTMRNLFMNPRNVFRVKEALLSMLAGDIFGDTPIWPSLRMFKAIYYLSAAFNARNSLRAWKTRRRMLRQAEDAGMTAG